MKASAVTDFSRGGMPIPMVKVPRAVPIHWLSAPAQTRCRHRSSCAPNRSSLFTTGLSTGRNPLYSVSRPFISGSRILGRLRTRAAAHTRLRQAGDPNAHVSRISAAGNLTKSAKLLIRDPRLHKEISRDTRKALRRASRDNIAGNDATAALWNKAITDISVVELRIPNERW